MKKLVYLVMLVALAAGSVGLGQDAPFAGETIEVIVPYREGGGTDIVARTIAPFLEKYLEGASVQVVNITGGSGVQGSNEFAVGRDRDGLTLLVSSGSMVFPYIFGDEAVQYEFNEYVSLLNAPIGAVVYVSPDTGISDTAGLCDADSLLVYGGVSAAGLDIVTLTSFELLGLDFFPILGYDGRGAARVAFEQGETTIDNQATSAFRQNVEPLVEEGQAVPLYTLGILQGGEVVRDPEYPDLPSFAEVYETCAGSPLAGPELDAYKAVLSAGYAAGKNLWVHADAPSERIAALQAAAEAIVTDEEFQATKGEVLGAYELSVNEASLENFSAASQIPPEAYDYLTNFLSEKYDLTF